MGILQKSNTRTPPLRLSSRCIFETSQDGGNPDALISVTLVYFPLIFRTDLFKTKIKNHDLIQRYTNVDLKISLYVLIHITIIF